MTDTYRLRLTVTSLAVGGISIHLERTSGTNCDEIVAEWTNYNYFVGTKLYQLMVLEPGYTIPESMTLRACFCLKAVEVPA